MVTKPISDQSAKPDHGKSPAEPTADQSAEASVSMAALSFEPSFDAPRLPTIQRQRAMLDAQRTIGNQAVLRRMAAERLLQRNPPDDPPAPAATPANGQPNAPADAANNGAGGEPDPDQLPDPSVIISAGSPSEAAELFQHYLDGRTRVRIIVADGVSATVFDEHARQVGGPFRFVPRVALPLGVFGSPVADRHLRALQRIANTGEVAFSQGIAMFRGQSVDFSRAFGPNQAAFNSAAGGGLPQFYVVPMAIFAAPADPHTPQPDPTQELPEFLRPQNAQQTATEPPIAAHMTPGAGWPRAVVGGFTDFTAEMDAHQWIQANLPTISFQWDVIKLRPSENDELGRMAGMAQSVQDQNTNAQVESQTAATSGNATSAAYNRRLNQVGSDGRQLLASGANQNTVLGWVQNFGVAELTGARAVLAMAGETVHQVTSFLVADHGIFRRMVSDMQIPWEHPGLYFVRVRANPITGDTGKHYATTVIAASVYVQDAAQLAQSGLDDRAPAQRQLDRLLAQRTQYQNAINQLRQVLPTVSRARRTEYQQLLNDSLAHLAEFDQQIGAARDRLNAVGNTRTQLGLQRSQAQEQLEELRDHDRPTDAQQAARYDAEIARLQNTITTASTTLTALAAPEGQPNTVSTPLPINFVNETTAQSSRMLFTITEQNHPENTSSPVEVRIIQITPSATPIVVFHGQGIDRAAAFNAALTDMRENFGHGRGLIAFRPEGPFASVPLTVPNPMPTVMTAGAQIADTAGDLSNLLTAIALLAAPFTAGGSLALLAPAGMIGAVGAGYRLANEAQRGNLHWNAQTVGDLFAVAGAVLPLTDKVARLGRIGLIISHAQYAMPLVEGGGYVVMGYNTFSAFASNDGTPDGRRAALETALSTVMGLTAGIAGRVHGAEVEANNPERQQQIQDQNQARIDSGQIGGLRDVPVEPAGSGAPHPNENANSGGTPNENVNANANRGGRPAESPQGNEHPAGNNQQAAPGGQNENAPNVAPPRENAPAQNPEGHAPAGAVEAEVAQIASNTHPDMAMLQAGESPQLLRLLGRAGSWRDLITALEANGRPEMRQIAQHLARLRQSILNELQPFHARPVDSASTEAVSDVDMNVSGPNAGRDLINAEAYMARQYGPNWSRMLRMNFYTEAGRLTMFESALPQLSPAARQALRANLSERTTVYNLARMMENASHAATPEAQSRMRGEVTELSRSLGLNEAQAAEVQRLGSMTEAQHTARRNELLLQIDELVQQRNATADPAQQAELAQQITQMQVEANLHTVEAYIGPGAGLQTVRGVRVQGHEAFQAALSHYEMLSHTLAEHGGDLVGAARQYELFKYVQRFTEAARTSGVSDARLAFFENLGNYLYRINRSAHGEDAHTNGPDPASQRGAAQDRNARNARNPDSTSLDMPFPTDPATAPVTDAFLLSTLQQFQAMARELLPQMQRSANNPAAPESPGASAGNESPRVIIDPSILSPQ